MRPVHLSLLSLLALVVFGASCSPSPLSHEGFTPAGDAGSTDAAGGAGAPLHMKLTWMQAPQSEILQCHYLKVPNDVAVEIGEINVQFPAGSHHVHTYHSIDPSTANVPDHVEDCEAVDWTVWGLTVGVQTTSIDWKLPKGVTVPMVPHEQLMVQVHWLNTTDQPINREIDITFSPAAYSDQHLGVVFGVARDVYMYPMQTKKVGNWAPIPSGVNITAMMGHYHDRGTHYQVDLRKQGESSGQLIYQAATDQTFQFQIYDTPPVTQPGQGLAFECDYLNDTQAPITWGANTTDEEHCNMAAYFYPAYPPLSHLALSGDIAAATVTPNTMAPGAPAQGQVTLVQQAGQLGVQVTLIPSSPGALTVPDMVQVPAWGMGATFTVAANTAGTSTLGFTTGQPPITTPIVVQGPAMQGAPGLVLSEVYYNPTGSDPTGLQWVEIANIGSAPIDLSGYSLGAGGPTYGTSRASVGSMMLPPDGCLVVGGPLDLPPSDPQANVFTVAEPFSPTLPTGATPGNGVALFNVPVGQPLPAGAVPVDAVVYGTANTNQLVGPNGQPATPVAAVVPGASLEMTTSWQSQPVPPPGICRVSHAP